MSFRNFSYYFFFFLFVSQLLAKDPCSISLNSVISYSQLNECFSKVENAPLNQQKVVDTTLGVLEQYVFKDIVQNSGSPYNIKVNLVSELEKIRSSDYNKDFDMHQAINSLLAELLDPHTMYFKPSCYSSFWILNPFQITAFPSPVENEDPLIYITGTNFDNSTDFINFYQGITGIDIKPFVGKQVEAINGINAWDYIVTESKKVWISKDLSSQINEYLALDWNQRHLAFESVPSHKNIYLTIEEEQFPFEYVAFSTNSFDDSDNFKQICLNGEKTEKILTKNINFKEYLHNNPILKKKQFKKKLDEYFQGLEDPEFEKTNKNKQIINDEESNLNVIIPRTHEVGLSIYRDTNHPGSIKYGILKIYSFNPEMMSTFRDTIDKCFDYLANHAVKYLIIDVRDNGGGYIDLGYQLFYYLFENQKDKFTPMISNNDVIHSTLHDEFFTKCAQNEICKDDDTMPFSPKGWYDINDKQFTNIGIYKPGKEYHRGGGVPRTFSTFLHEKVDLSWQNKNQLYFDKDHLLILSDGRCGSTCAIFTSKIFQNDLARTITIGGSSKKNSKASAISFPGGQVLDDYFFQVVYLYFTDNLQVPIDNMFDEYPSDQSLSFTWRELYPMDKNPEGSNPIPMEFLFYPSDIRILNWDFNNDEKIIAETVPYFQIGGPTPTPTSTPTVKPNPTPSNDTSDITNKIKLLTNGMSALIVLLVISVVIILILYVYYRKLKKQQDGDHFLEGESEEFEFETDKNSDIENANGDKNDVNNENDDENDNEEVKEKEKEIKDKEQNNGNEKLIN
ncbi:peptidase s41 family protein [Anaeramoeba flamelloides]|uniref:Peptidase s41 family protein n=1 Tax=Anaeramoeba flamelloides TaxID=1746091 RepID=A0ABQ8X0T6_9EUKA|nr:peptidase s41 family protein [Anaeramoeba flamelloides]